MRRIISVALCLLFALVMLAGCVTNGSDSDRDVRPERGSPTETEDAIVTQENKNIADDPAKGDTPGMPDSAPSPSGEPGGEPEVEPINREPLPFSSDGAKLLHAVEGRIAPDMPAWSYELYGTEPDGYGGFERMWLIIRDGSGQIVDGIESITEGGARDDPNIVLVDADFDGYMDVMYSEGALGAHGHYWYHLLNWRPGQNQYMQTEGFDQICNPVVDGQDRVVRSLGANSAFEDMYSIYRHENGAYLPEWELYLLREEENGREIYTFSLFYYENNVRMTGSVYSTTEYPQGPGYSPDEEEFFGPGSLWKLDDPIWFQSRHFQGT
jgi:hypothetical protein